MQLLDIPLFTDFPRPCDDTEISLSKLFVSNEQSCHRAVDEDVYKETDWKNLDARSIVLRKCDQARYLPFEDCYSEQQLKNCHKIGEGVYGEVFLFRNDEKKPIVMKVIPIEGDVIVNDEKQKKFDEVISEIVIATELSDLRNDDHNNTTIFNKVHRVRCVSGCYPSRLIELWDLFDDVNGSENDRPTIFEPNQLYIILELDYGGKDIESFSFTTAEQSCAVFTQIAYALAVAEEAFQFEHRDLHWGNVLVSYTSDEYVDFKLQGASYSIPTHGVIANIIDYTLARATFPKFGCTAYYNLANEDELFNADSEDYQFDIYRLMKQENGNNWEGFEPYTNILWLHYLLGKMLERLRYTTTFKSHYVYMRKLKRIRSKILDYNSCVNFVMQMKLN